MSWSGSPAHWSVITLACNCGGNSGGKIQYEVKLNNGTVKTVGTMAEVRLALATGGGGSYKSVPVK